MERRYRSANVEPRQWEACNDRIKEKITNLGLQFRKTDNEEEDKVLQVYFRFSWEVQTRD